MSCWALWSWTVMPQQTRGESKVMRRDDSAFRLAGVAPLEIAQTGPSEVCAAIAQQCAGHMLSFRQCKNHSQVLLTASLCKCKEESEKGPAVQVKKKIPQWKQAWGTASGRKTISESERFVNPQRKLLIWLTWQICLDVYHRCRQGTSALCLFPADSLNFHVIGSHCSLTSCCPCLTEASRLILICAPSKLPLFPQPVKSSACCSVSP